MGRKDFFIILFALGLLCSSCSNREKSGKEVFPRYRLANTAYQLSDDFDTTTCNSSPIETDFFPILLFLDDTTFIKIIHTCCSGDSGYFASKYYYTGRYVTDNKQLTLSFDTILTILLELEVESDTLSPTKITKQIIHDEREELVILACKNDIYFKMKSGPWKDAYLSSTNHSVQSFLDK